MSKHNRPLGWDIYVTHDGSLGDPAPVDPERDHAGFVANTRRYRMRQRLGAFWRWYTKPATSLADAMLIGVLIAGMYALHLDAGWPWWASLAVVIAAFCAAAFLRGFVAALVRLVRRRLALPHRRKCLLPRLGRPLLPLRVTGCPCRYHRRVFPYRP